MGEGTKQFQEFDQLFSSNSSESSTSSIGSSSSDLTEDATSLSSSYNSSVVDSIGPLYELDCLMDQLPIKRGLSMYYQGKSQSFTSLSNVRCLDDLPKKENGYNKRMKSCRSYAGCLDGSNNINRSFCAPRPCNKIISKKGSSRNLSSSFGPRRCGSGTFVSGRLPPVPVQKK